MATGTSAAIVLDPSSGYLSPGRHRVVEADVYSRFVSHPDFAASTTRAEIWQQFEDARDLLASKIRVHAYWLGGSFTTSKVDPGDIDALFIINGRDYAKTDANAKKVIASFEPIPGPSGKPVRLHGLDHVESFLMQWRPWSPFRPGHPLGTPEETTYAVERGYWDDWWQRDRYNKPDGKPIHWRDALPVRGYLEVELNAFTA
jgi:hypothetical protein